MEPEATAAGAYFQCIDSRVDVQRGDLVIGRYSVLPYYRELDADLKKLGASLINTYGQHRYIADMRNWLGDLEPLTPRTWFDWRDVDSPGPFVIKGETNSRKFLWDTHMFAQDKRDAIQVMERLMDDTLIGAQRLCIRQYVPLEQLAEGLHGLPITREFRFFVAYEQVLAGGFYWSSHADDLREVPQASEVPEEFLRKVTESVGDRADFYVVDIAKTVSGDWIVIELNDGQMSGLSEVSPGDLYRNLRGAIRARGEE